MKKTTIWILGIVMGLSFLSLLYLQISYIEEMATMRNEQFDESVKRALLAASKDVESEEVDRWLREDISTRDRNAWSQSSQNAKTQSQSFTITGPDGSKIELKTFSGGTQELPKAMISRRHGTKTIPQTSRSMADMLRNRYLYQRDLLERLIKEFRLQKVRKNKGDQLSGGERRRTEIARCLAIEPKFIMLDEPFAGVDPIAVEDIQQIVWKLKDRNIGILITDHNVDETLAITDRAYLLFEGRILFKGTPEELAANQIVREKYLTESFELRKKQFQKTEEPGEDTITEEQTE